MLYHKYKNIATPRMSTYNANGYSSRQQGVRTDQTKLNLECLGRISDIIITQESKTFADAPFYEGLLREFHHFPNPNPVSDASAGTDFFLRRETARDTTLTPKIIVPGYVQMVEVEPTGADPVFTSSYTVLNAYIPCGTGSNEAERISVLEAIKNTPIRTQYVMMGGDWNLVQRSSDCAGGNHYSSTKRVLAAFEAMLNEHKLKEVFQPLHTRVQGTQSSRLDRWYVSHEAPDKCCMEPESTIPQHPYLPGQGMNKGPTDHFPVRLAFYPPKLSRGVRYKIPEWIASHPKYHARVRETFGKQKLNGHPVRDLLAFKKCCKEAASHVKKELTSYATQHAASLTRSIGTLRELKAGTPLCVVTPHTKSDQALNQAVLQDCKIESKDFPNLRKHIKATLSSSSLAIPHTGRTHSFLREAKTSLPAERRHLTHLEHKGKILENSADVAQALKEVWTPIWNNPDPCDDVVEEYLNWFAKKIKSQPCAQHGPRSALTPKRFGHRS